MILRNWSVVIAEEFDPYKAPELYAARLHGNVYGHHKFVDGAEITTSRVVGVTENAVLTNSGSTYELGEVNPEYEKLFPDARKRILTQA